MSRYRIHSEGPIEVVVGWDDPMGSFFGHEYDEREDDELVASCGTLPHTVPTIDALHEWVRARGFAIPRDVVKSLEIDYERHDAWVPGPLQKALGFTGEKKDG